jgi:hypothetical protein
LLGGILIHIKVRSRFLKKAAQKFFATFGLWPCNGMGPNDKRFFASFCSQKEAFLSF